MRVRVRACAQVQERAKAKAALQAQTVATLRENSELDEVGRVGNTQLDEGKDP